MFLDGHIPVLEGVDHPPMFAIDIGNCANCGCIEIGQEHWYCTFPGSRIDPPEFEEVFLCFDCLRNNEEAEAMYEAMMDDLAEQEKETA